MSTLGDEYAALDWHPDGSGGLSWSDDMPSIDSSLLALLLDCPRSAGAAAMDNLLRLHADAASWRSHQADAASRRPRITSVAE